jgi:hypothetical protein
MARDPSERRPATPRTTTPRSVAPRPPTPPRAPTYAGGTTASRSAREGRAPGYTNRAQPGAGSAIRAATQFLTPQRDFRDINYAGRLFDVRKAEDYGSPNQESYNALYPMGGYGSEPRAPSYGSEDTRANLMERDLLNERRGRKVPRYFPKQHAGIPFSELGPFGYYGQQYYSLPLDAETQAPEYTAPGYTGGGDGGGGGYEPYPWQDWGGGGGGGGYTPYPQGEMPAWYAGLSTWRISASGGGQ